MPACVSIAQQYAAPSSVHVPNGISSAYLWCRRAYELAFASAYMFAGVRPIFKEIDEVTFKRPVDIGDLLRLTSSIVHTQPVSQDSDKVCSAASRRHMHNS